MNYALIESGIVVNIIWLHPGNAANFPNAVEIGERPAGIGDTYTGGKFYRDGKEILTPTEQRIADLEKELAATKILLGVE